MPEEDEVFGIALRDGPTTERRRFFDENFVLHPSENGLPSYWTPEECPNPVAVLPPYDPASFPDMPAHPSYDPRDSWSIYVPHMKGKGPIGEWQQLTGEDAEDKALRGAIGFARQRLVMTKGPLRLSDVVFDALGITTAEACRYLDGLDGYPNLGDGLSSITRGSTFMVWTISREDFVIFVDRVKRHREESS